MVTPYYEQDGITIYHGDCREVLPGMEVDAIVTDPPYGTGGWRRLEAGAGSNPSGSLVRETWDMGDVEWMALPRSDVFAVFWPPARTRLLLEAAEVCGATKHRCLYMRKRDPKPMVAGRTRWSVEPIWVLSKDGYVLTGGDDVYEDSTPRMGRDIEAVGHPYQKPVAVMQWLLSKMPGAYFCDPFMGSGTTLVAAKNRGLACIGIEIEERYCEIAAKRLSQSVMFGADVA